MKYFYKSLLLLALVFFNDSCTIQKRVHRNGYFINGTLFNKNESKSTDNFLDESKQVEKRAFKNIGNYSISQIKDSINTLQLVENVKISSIVESCKNEKVLKKFDRINLKGDTSVKKGTVNPLNIKLISSENTSKKGFDWDDFSDTLFLILRWILLAFLIFLLGLGIHAIFPSISFIAAFLFGVSFVVLLFLIFILIYISFSNSVC